MSPELKQFYRDMQAWIDEGMPRDRDFVRNSGLCKNLGKWLDQQEARLDTDVWIRLCYDLYRELKQQFRDEALDAVYPFNINSADYEAEILRTYQNPARLTWIKEHAE